MKITEVTIASGAGYTNVPCTGPYHKTKMYDKASTRVQLDFKLLDDSFVAVQSTTSVNGHVIELEGPGISGILGRPADYNAKGTPATADVIAKVRTTAAAGCTLVMEEYQ